MKCWTVTVGGESHIPQVREVIAYSTLRAAWRGFEDRVVRCAHYGGAPWAMRCLVYLTDPVDRDIEEDGDLFDVEGWDRRWLVTDDEKVYVEK